MTFGLGLLVGNFISGQIIDHFSGTVNDVRTYDWNSIWGITSGMSFALLLSFAILFKNERKAVVNIGSVSKKQAERRDISKRELQETN